MHAVHVLETVHFAKVNKIAQIQTPLIMHPNLIHIVTENITPPTHPKLIVVIIPHNSNSLIYILFLFKEGKLEHLFQCNKLIGRMLPNDVI